jgi:NFU1 iron-sulfur cluster scaffold homolog, mitochondrial
MTQDFGLRTPPTLRPVPIKISQFQTTPNPNAIKCVLDHRLADTPRSYFNAQQAAEDPLAVSLFAIPGVTNLLIHETFITVGKSAEADWKTVKAAVERVLRDTAE